MTTVHAEVRKIHSGRISLTPSHFASSVLEYVLFSPFPVPNTGNERNYTQIGLIEIGATVNLDTLQPSNSLEFCSSRTFKFNPKR